MISKFTCTACKTEVTKENGAQPGCPACGFGWLTLPNPNEHSPWTFPYEPVIPYDPYLPYVPTTFPWPPGRIIYTTGTSSAEIKYDPNNITTSTGFKYGNKEN